MYETDLKIIIILSFPVIGRDTIRINTALEYCKGREPEILVHRLNGTQKEYRGLSMRINRRNIGIRDIQIPGVGCQSTRRELSQKTPDDKITGHLLGDGNHDPHHQGHWNGDQLTEPENLRCHGAC